MVVVSQRKENEKVGLHGTAFLFVFSGTPGANLIPLHRIECVLLCVGCSGLLSI